MIFDKNLLFSENQAVSVDAISENVMLLVDVGTVYGESAGFIRNLGAGTVIPFLIQVTEDFATLTSLTITIETSAAAALTSSNVLYITGAIPVADLVAGYVVPMRWMPDADPLDYIGLQYDITDTTASAAFITGW